MGAPAPFPYWYTKIDHYPSGPHPWSGQPAAVEPTQFYFVPSTKIPAEWENWVYGTLFAQDNTLRDFVTLPRWRSSNPKSSYASSSNGIVAAAWDPFNLVWMIGTTAGSGSHVNITYGQDPQCVQGDANTPALGSSLAVTPSTTMALVADPGTPNVFWMAIISDDGSNNGKVFVYKCVAGVWSLNFTLSSLLSSSSEIQSVEFATIGTTIVLAVGNQNTNFGFSTALLYKTASGGWNSPAGTNIFGAIPWWYLKSSGSQVLAMPGYLAGVTSGQKYLTSPDGVTWTTQTLPLSVQGNNGQIVGLCWSEDASGPCWILAVWDSVLGKTQFFRSSDGMNWSFQAAPATAFKVADMEAQGTLIVASLLEATSGGPSQAIYSPDGGITWYFGSVALATSAAGTTEWYTRPRVFMSPTQLLYLNDNWLRFSEVSGQPLLPM